MVTTLGSKGDVCQYDTDCEQQLSCIDVTGAGGIGYCLQKSASLWIFYTVLVVGLIVIVLLITMAFQRI